MFMRTLITLMIILEMDTFIITNKTEQLRLSIHRKEEVQMELPGTLATDPPELE